MAEPERLFADIEAVLERLISQQRAKIAEVAQDIMPHLTAEQAQNPQDYPEIAADAMYNFEDGLLAGLISARMALRTSVFEAHRASDASR
jgi:hypothetical protein